MSRCKGQMMRAEAPQELRFRHDCQLKIGRLISAGSGSAGAEAIPDRSLLHACHPQYIAILAERSRPAPQPHPPYEPEYRLLVQIHQLHGQMTSVNTHDDEITALPVQPWRF